MAIAAFFATENRALCGVQGFANAVIGAGSSSLVCQLDDLTQKALQKCVGGDAPVSVRFRRPGTVRVGPVAVQVGSNKTIDGGGRITILGPAGLFDLRSRNVIVRGIRFASTLTNNRPGEDCASPVGPREVAGCGVSIGIRAPASGIWIDHNEFFHCGDKCIVVWADAARTPVNGHIPSPDLISISSNYLHDSYFGILVGVAAQVPASMMPLHERVTIYDNYFRNILRRSPRAASGAWIHAFNNVVEDFGSDGPCRGAGYGFASSSVGSAQLYLENNVYIAWPRGCKGAVSIEGYGTSMGDRGRGLVKSVGNLALNGAVLDEYNPSGVFDPHKYYQYNVLPAQMLIEAIERSAGPH